MKIVSAKAEYIRYQSRMVRDGEGHSHPGKPHEAKVGFLTIVCDDGTEGQAVDGNMLVDVLNRVVAPAIIGEDPFMHEHIWQRMRTWQRLHSDFTDRTLCALDLALWDICGKKCGVPVYKLLGGYKDKVPAYGSIMVGDDIKGGLDTPEAYAEFAKKLVAKGYKAIKLHTWMPPIIPNPDPKLDVKACQMVRDAVGPDIALMLDPYHDYTREQALYIADALYELGFLWMEEPMDEHSMSSYVWLNSHTRLPICGPETVEGKNRTRADWIAAGASDIGRAGTEVTGGITSVMKSAHLYESFGMNIELHGNTIGNLHVLGAIPNGEYFERGLLHPLLDYETPKPWFKSIYDPMDENGFVSIPSVPGLGWDFDYDYIKDNIVV